MSPEVQAFATGFPTTLLHAGVTLLILVLGAGIYILLTPHKEIRLIREGNAAAAVSLAGVMVGLSIPLAVSLNASTIAVQLLAFRLVDLVLHGLPKRIADGEMAAAALLVGSNLATAIILAAAMGG